MIRPCCCRRVYPNQNQKNKRKNLHLQFHHILLGQQVHVLIGSTRWTSSTARGAIGDLSTSSWRPSSLLRRWIARTLIHCLSLHRLLYVLLLWREMYALGIYDWWRKLSTALLVGLNLFDLLQYCSALQMKARAITTVAFLLSIELCPLLLVHVKRVLRSHL